MTVRPSGCGTCISFWVFVTVLVTGNVKRLTLLDFHPHFRIKSGQDKIKTRVAHHFCFNNLLVGQEQKSYSKFLP